MSGRGEKKSGNTTLSKCQHSEHTGIKEIQLPPPFNLTLLLIKSLHSSFLNKYPIKS